MSELAPVAPRERVVVVDVLRGFALCGVLIGNMILYSGAWAVQRGPHAAAPELSTLDTIANWFGMIFVHGRAQTMLTLLFGFGFATQLLRAEQRGEPVIGLYVRRLVALFVLGVLHIAALWWGDVTWTYAVSGFGLLAFVGISNRARVLWALGFTFVPYLAMSIPEVRMATMQVFLEPREFSEHTARMGAALHGEGRAGLAWEHLRYALVWSAQLYVWYFLWVLGRFLLGYVAGKLRWFDRDGADHLPVFRRLAIWGGGIAIVTTALTVLRWLGWLAPRELGLWAQLVAGAIEQIWLLAFAAMYVGIAVLLIQRPGWRRLLRVVAPAGRMPLTVYFSQSLVCTFLFYGWGLGWAGSVGIAGCLGLAVGIFCVQVAMCHAWLRSFRFGPVEWLWRSVAYWKLQPMRILPRAFARVKG